MLRVIRTELYFNPFEVKWLAPELVISNPGISAAFFRCDPRSFDFEKVFSTNPVSLTADERSRAVSAFLDAALQNAHGLEHPAVLNSGPISKIFGSEIIVEHSPPEGILFGKLLSSASLVTIGTYVGLQGMGGSPLLFVAVPAGIIVVGAAVAIVRAFDRGLTHVIERATSRNKTPSVRPTPTATTEPTTRTTKRRGKRGT
jgi:hypothetical protein